MAGGRIILGLGSQGMGEQILQKWEPWECDHKGGVQDVFSVNRVIYRPDSDHCMENGALSCLAWLWITPMNTFPRSHLPEVLETVFLQRALMHVCMKGATDNEK